jgi:hypothetical protein
MDTVVGRRWDGKESVRVSDRFVCIAAQALARIAAVLRKPFHSELKRIYATVGIAIGESAFFFLDVPLQDPLH